MAQIARLKAAEISPGNSANAADVEAELDQLVNKANSLDTSVTALESGNMTITGNKTFSGTTVFSGTANTISGVAFPDVSELTIATGAITVTGTSHTVDTESDAASDDLDTINGGTNGKVIILMTENDSRDVVIKHNTGNIFLETASDYTLESSKSTITLMYSSALSKWVEIARAKASSPIATQAEMETGTSTTVMVTPGRQHYHFGHPKAHAAANQTGTQAIIGTAYNVTSITDGGVGITQFNFTTSFSSANYAVIPGATVSLSANQCYACVSTRATGSVIINMEPSAGGGGGRADSAYVSIVVLGDL